MQRHAIAKDAAIVDGHVGIEDAIVADPCVAADVAAGIDHAAIADPHALGDDCERADVAILAERRAFMHDSQLADSRSGLLAETHQFHHRITEGEVWSIRDQHRASFLNQLRVFGAEHDCAGLTGLHLPQVFAIGQKAQVRGAGIFKRGTAVDFDIALATQLGADFLSEFLSG